MKHWSERVVVATAVMLGWVCGPAPSEAICRVVEPARDSGDPGVPFDPTTSAMYVLTPDVLVDYQCPLGDGGIEPDAGFEPDAGLEPDGGGIEPDAGASLDAGGVDDGEDDAGSATDAGFVADAGEADAGASMDAGLVDAGDLADGGVGAMMPDAGHPAICADGTLAEEVRDTLLSIVVQPSILASGGTAGLVMPVPGRPDVAVGSSALFADAASLMRAEVHETVRVREDAALGAQCTDPHFSASAADILAAAPLMLYGCSADSGSDYYRPGTEGREPEITSYGDAGTVRYETFPSTDAYDVTVLNATSLEALTAWLEENGFQHDSDDDAAFGAYVSDGAWFVAVHVHPPDTGEALVLNPLVVTWIGDTLPITHELQHDPDGGLVVTDAFVIAPTRMDANDGSAFTEYAAPTTFALTGLAGFGQARGWLTRLSIQNQTSENVDDAQLVPSHVGLEERPSISRVVEARIPAPCCAGSNLTTDNPSALRTYEYERTYVEGTAPPIPPGWLGASPPLDARYCNDSYGSSGSSGSSGSRLRGCSTYTPEQWSAVVGGWGPIFLALSWVVWRSRRR